MLDFTSEISQLRSRVHTKVNSAHESTVGATANSDSIAKIETDIAANLETEQVPKQSTEKYGIF